MDLASFFGKLAGSAGGAVLGGALLGMRDYVTHLGASAVEKWSVDYAMGVTCTAPSSKRGCGVGSFGRCDGQHFLGCSGNRCLAKTQREYHTPRPPW